MTLEHGNGPFIEMCNNAEYKPLLFETLTHGS